MATKRVCDRCGAEINPYNSVTYAGMRQVKNDINDNDYELCVSCAHKLRKWFNGEEKLPAADVAPVRRGRWAHLGGDEWCCSACGFVITTEGSWDKPTKKYCEDCGAKMDGGDNDAAD
jgi:hypothetical protein